MRRYTFLMGLPLLLVVPLQAQALSMRVVSSQVMVDLFGRAETTVRDRPPKTSSVLTLDAVAAIFVGGGTAAGTGTALSERRPFQSAPNRLETIADIGVEARSSGAGLDAESSSVAAGSLRVAVSSTVPGELDPGLSFEIRFEPPDNPVADLLWSVSYLVFNETTGTPLFSLAATTGGTLPTGFAVPVGFEDVIRIEWRAEISAAVAGIGTVGGDLGLFGSFGPATVVIPEAGVSSLLLAGLLALGAGRRSFHPSRSLA